MDPTILQRLYSSKHTLKVSSKYEIDGGALIEVGDQKIEYIFHPEINSVVMTEPEIPDIGHDLPIKICWYRWSDHLDHDGLRFRSGHDKSIDYEYIAQQCINDPSTINFGFKFTNGPYTGSSHRSEARFEIDSNAHMIKIMPYSGEQVPCQTLDMVIQHIKDINVECDYLNEFWWTNFSSARGKQVGDDVPGRFLQGNCRHPGS